MNATSLSQPSSHKLSPDRLDALARRRAGAKIGWYLHAAVYLCVNAGLLLLSWSQGRHWALYPALGWGLGLLAHGAAVWALMPGSSLMRQLVARERERLEREGTQ
ncbi:2TM domain-containing protein [Xenophilus arseniciresistens]|uniref:2TM domain-containing protein n=1 Tax=Xenophilus arseniciresistens TaxID=1283306 RepID=A0AAE3N583_9BURK|nr:2TM domain-containing protein [Xenophilus arseniciresistens]MDA7414838.1 2TM domain-containing protein [Xenophilus arseniciresistens]